MKKKAVNSKTKGKKHGYNVICVINTVTEKLPEFIPTKLLKFIHQHPLALDVIHILDGGKRVDKWIGHIESITAL